MPTIKTHYNNSAIWEQLQIVPTEDAENQPITTEYNISGDNT